MQLRAIAAVTAALAGVGFAQTTTRLSSGVFQSSPSQGSIATSMSIDGRFVAFQSVASNLVPNDTNAQTDVFVIDLASGVVERANVSSAGAQAANGGVDPSISAHGRFVAFSSFSPDLVLSDENGMSDIFVRDRLLGTTEIISADANGEEGEGQSYSPSISGDGRFVAFQSHAGNLVLGASGHVLVRDRTTGAITVASVDSNGVLGNYGAYEPAISADGRYVAFQSASTNLTPGDALPFSGGNGWDVFVHDRTTGVTAHVSADMGGAYPNAGATDPAISADGRFVLFSSGATDIVAGDAPGSYDVFVRDMIALQTTRASEAFGGGNAPGSSSVGALSADGRWIVFHSNAPNLTQFVLPSSTGQAYRRDRIAGTNEVVSASNCGVPGSGNAASGTSSSLASVISGDGTRVAFVSYAATLVPGGTLAGAGLFLRDFSIPTSGVACSFCLPPTTSSGCVPTIQGTGVPSASAGSGFVVSIEANEGQRMGIAFFSSVARNPGPWSPQSSSYLCLNATGRLPAQIGAGNPGECDGVHAWDWNEHVANDPYLASVYVAGRPVFMQSWFRDTPAPTGTNLSGGLQFVMGP